MQSVALRAIASTGCLLRICDALPPTTVDVARESLAEGGGGCWGAGFMMEGKHIPP